MERTRTRAHGVTAASARAGAAFQAGNTIRLVWTDYLLALALLGWWLAWLGAAPLFDIDEGAFAEATREMLASRDWWHTTLNGADRFDKPILIYWLQAASVTLFGRNEFAVRLPSALAAWGWCMATAGLVGPRWGRKAAMLAAVIVATSVGPMLIGRGATADALLNLLLALALFDLIRFVEANFAGDADHGATALRRVALWVGLGILTKGPVAVLVPAGALVLWAATAGRPGRRVLLQSLRDPLSWLIAAAVSVPWYAYALHRHGWAFVEGFVMRHNVERFTGTLEGHGGSLFYYVLVLPLLMLPWTPLLAPVVRDLWRRARREGLDATTALLCAWTVFVLAFFSFSGTKLPHYLLYGYTPIAALAGAWLARSDRRRPSVLLVFVMCVVLVAATLFSPDIAAALGARQKDVFWHALTQRDSLPRAPALPWALAAGAVLAGAFVIALSRPARGWIACAAAALATSLWFNAQVVPWWGETLQGPVKALALDAATRDLPLVQWRVNQPSAAFYRNAVTLKRPPAAGEAALTRIDRMNAPGVAGDDRPQALKVLRQERGLGLVAVPSP